MSSTCTRATGAPWSTGGSGTVHRSGPASTDSPPCTGTRANLYFSEDPGEVELAKSLCVSCPGRARCLAGAMERREPWGVWGGELFHAGAVVGHRRRRGRPRKDGHVD